MESLAGNAQLLGRPALVSARLRQCLDQNRALKTVQHIVETSTTAEETPGELDVPVQRLRQDLVATDICFDTNARQDVF